MELSSLVRARGVVVRAAELQVVALAVLATSTLAGCHSGAAGGRDKDAAVERAPEVGEKLPPPDAYCAPDASGGNGECPVNFCGQPKAVAALQAGELAQLGADVICTPGYACVPDVATVAGDALLLRCVVPLTPAVGVGLPCTKGAGTPMRCKNDALCIDAPGAPGTSFCAALCRADADCATDSYCLEYKSSPLPKGSYVNLGYCTPKSKIGAPACTREADCAAGQGCVAYGARTNLLTCQKIGGPKSLGEACTMGSQCRSGECFDRDFKMPAAGNRDFCSGRCAKNSDCGADQGCARLVLANNGTPADPFDDVVAGYCRSLFTPTAAQACKVAADCAAGGADTCDATHGLCYKAGAATGTPCTVDAGCELGAVCAQGVRFPGGYCQTLGCAPGATMGVDACPGAKSVCAQRAADAPLDACYEGCGTASACSRSAESYVCSPPTSSGGAASICLFDQGV